MRFGRDGRKLKFRIDREPDYMRFISEQGCICCNQRPVEVAHCGDHGMAQRAPDSTCLPICAIHHRTGKYAQHLLGKSFFAHHGLDRDALIAMYRAMYAREQKRAA